MQEDMKIDFQDGNESAISEYEEIMDRLDRLDDKVEFVRAEIAQNTGRRIGRDTGIIYGIIIGFILFVLYVMLKYVIFLI